MYWNLTDNERLVTALLLTTDPETMRKFLADLLEEKEIDVLETRLKAMFMLSDAAPYRAIQNITGLSSKTVARLAKKVWKRDGGFHKIRKLFLERGPTYSE